MRSLERATLAWLRSCIPSFLPRWNTSERNATHGLCGHTSLDLANMNLLLDIAVSRNQHRIAMLQTMTARLLAFMVARHHKAHATCAQECHNMVRCQSHLSLLSRRVSVQAIGLCWPVVYRVVELLPGRIQQLVVAQVLLGDGSSMGVQHGGFDAI